MKLYREIICLKLSLLQIPKYYYSIIEYQSLYTAISNLKKSSFHRFDVVFRYYDPQFEMAKNHT